MSLNLLTIIIASFTAIALVAVAYVIMLKRSNAKIKEIKQESTHFQNLLAQSKDTLFGILGNRSCAIVITDYNGHVSLCNQLATTVLKDFFVNDPEKPLAVFENIDIAKLFNIPAFKTREVGETIIHRDIRTVEEIIYKITAIKKFINGQECLLINAIADGDAQKEETLFRIMIKSHFSILKNEGISALTISDKGMIIQSNDHSVKHLATEKPGGDKFIGQLLWDILETADSEQKSNTSTFIDLQDQAIIKGSASTLVYNKYVTPVTYLNFHLYKLPKSVTHHDSFLVIISDQKKKINNSEVDNSQSIFLSSLGHEIRTPLGGILGMAQLVKESDSISEIHSLTESITNSGNDLLKILNNFLDMNKIETGNITLEKVPFNANQALDDVIRTFITNAQNKGVTLEKIVNIEGEAVFMGDKVRIKQILNNLVSNAIKFTEEGKVQITISQSKSNESGKLDCLVFDVKDSGIGIEPAKAEKLFKPFSQADSTITRRFGGTGLGLFICKRLSEMLGGTLTFKSVRYEGTTFTLTIPIERLNISTDKIKPADLKEVTQTNRLGEKFAAKILVAEDSDVNFKVLETFLNKNGYSCEHALNGKDAVTIYQKNHPDIIFMDLQMPLMDGLEATTEIRKLSKKSDVPLIIAITATSAEDERANCLATGMNDFLEKPVRKSNFEEILIRNLEILHNTKINATSKS